RLHFAIGALSGALAGAETESLIDEFSQRRTMNDVQMIARLSSLIDDAQRNPGCLEYAATRKMFRDAMLGMFLDAL
ncbi:hypothetical protein SB778_47055, partial [Paraburkholderia sp. SIMBA_050]